MKYNLHIDVISEKLISFCNLITWPILIQMNQNFNSKCRNNSKFFGFFFLFRYRNAIHLKRDLNIKHTVKIWDYLNKNWSNCKIISIFLKHPVISNDIKFSLIGIILRWGFLIWELIFYLLQTFCLHLGSFCVVSSFTTFRPNFTSGLLQVISDIKFILYFNNAQLFG